MIDPRDDLLCDLFDLVPRSRRVWVETNWRLLMEYEALGLRYDALDGHWVLLPGAEIPSGLIVPVPGVIEPSPK